MREQKEDLRIEIGRYLSTHNNESSLAVLSRLATLTAWLTIEEVVLAQISLTSVSSH